MTKAFVLMTALPPTTGHLQLIQFAEHLAGDDGVTVMLTTQPDEPFVQERVRALGQAVHRRGSMTQIKHYARPMNPDPSSKGFRDRWAGIMIGAGAEPGDLLVISEEWGRWLAELTDMDWRPYDVKREINPAKATSIRNDPTHMWRNILPEFRRHLQTRVTIFGAESTGKTTLASALKSVFQPCTVLPEYARPYLETVGNEINTASMTAIYEGQRALQRAEWNEHALVIQDTDLFSTLGYWQYFSFTDRIGYHHPPPWELRNDALALASDLYIVTPSVIPFEADPLRYGGDHREIEDDYWIKLLSGQKLNYVVLPRHPEDWVNIAKDLIQEALEKKGKLISYDRKGF